jgi:tetratricopeptide (TPR) repeat protein
MKGLLTALFLIIFYTLGWAQEEAEKRAVYDQKFQEAMELMNAFQFKQAQDLLSQCYIEYPNDVQYLSKLAYCYFQSGRYKDSRMFYGEVLKNDSLNTNAISTLGSIYERESNYPQAQKQYQKLIEIDSTNSYYFKRAGYTALRLGNVLAGIGYFLRAHDISEHDIEVIDQLVTIYLSLGELDYAETLLKKGLYLDAKNIKLLHNKARLNQKRKNHEAVIEAIEAAMEQGDTSNYYQMMIGVAYLQVDSVDKSIFHLESIVAREKDTEHTHHYLGLAYREKREIDKSIEHLKKAIELGISTKIDIYHSDLGSILETEYQYKEAAHHFEKALEYTGKAEYLFHLARNCDLYYKDKKIALKYYKRYLATSDKKYKDYTQQRIEQLKEIVHFQQ